MPSSSEMPASAPRACVVQKVPATVRLPSGIRSVHDRLNSRSARRRARVSYCVVSNGLPFNSTRRPRTIGRNSGLTPIVVPSHVRASSTCSGSTLTRNWLGASGGRLARQSRRRSPRTTVSSRSDVRPRASAPICRLDASARRRRFASPNRHDTPRCGTRFSSVNSSHASAAAAISRPATPPSMIVAACASCACQAISTATTAAPQTYARIPAMRGRGRSRRSTRNGGTFASATSGGSANPNNSSTPVANAFSAGSIVGSGSVSTNAVASIVASNC